MSSSALPPLTGVGSAGAKEEREDQRVQKVKPLPLMLSSRAPLVQATGTSLAAGSSGPAAARGRPGAGPPPLPQQAQQPYYLHPAAAAAAEMPSSPGSPTGQHMALRSKFTRIRGVQASPPLGLEGSGLLQTPQQQGGGQLPPGPGGRPGSQDISIDELRHSWDGGAGSPELAASPPRLGSGGRVLGGGRGLNGTSSGGALLGSAGAASLADGTWQQANGGGGGGGGGSSGGGSSGGGRGGGGASSAWAARRAGLTADRSALVGSPQQQQQRLREASPFEGPSAGLILGANTTGLSLAAVGGSAPLAFRPAGSAPTAPKPFSPLAPTGGPLYIAGRPDTAPSSPSQPPPPPPPLQLLDPLSATFPAATLRGAQPHTHGLVPLPSAAINPPLQLLTAAWPGNVNGLGQTEVAAPPHAPTDGPQSVPRTAPSGHSNHAAAAPPPPADASATVPTSESSSPQRQQQPSATAAQLLQRLYRTNRTPPTSQTDSLLLDPLSPGQRQATAAADTAASTAAATAAAARSDSCPGDGRAPGLLTATAAAAMPSRAISPGLTPLLGPPLSSLLSQHHTAAAAASATQQQQLRQQQQQQQPQQPQQQLRTRSRSGGGGGGGGGTAASSLSGVGPTPSVVASHLGINTTATVGGSINLAAGLLNRPRGRNAAAGTLADLSAALQKSIAAGMGEWDLRADGTWGHPEIRQRLLRGPLGPEALKNRYRMQERDIISLYRLLYSYSVGFFTDVESLLDIAVSDRNSGAAMGLAAGTSLRQELLESVFRAYAMLWDEALMIVFDSEMTSMLADKNAALRALDRGAVELEAIKREKQELQSRLEDFMKQNVDNMLASRHLQQATAKLEGEVYTLHNANEHLVTNMARHAVQVATLERQLDAARAATQAAELRAAAAEAHLHDLKSIVSGQNATLSAQFFQIKELERMCGELQETVRNLNRRRAAVLGLLSGNTSDPSEPGAGGGAAVSPAAATATNTAAAATAGGPRGTAAATAAGLTGSSSRVLGTGSGGASGSGGPAPPPAGTGDGGVAPPGTPPGGGAGGGGSGAGLDSSTEGVMADLSLLDPDELGRLLSDKTRAFNLMHADFVVKMHELDDQRSVNASLLDEVAALKVAVQNADAAAAASDRVAARFRAKFEAGRMAMEDLEEKNRKLTHKNAELVRSYWPLMTRLKDAEAEAAVCREEAARDRAQAEADRAEADVLRAEASDTRAAMKELEERRAEAASHELELPADLLALLPENQVAALRRFARSCHRRVAHLNSQVVALVDQVTQARLAALLNKEQQLLQAAGGGDGDRGGSGGGGSDKAIAESAIAAALAEASELRLAVANRDKWLAVLTKAMSALMSQMENLMARDWETCRTLRLEQDRRKKRAAREARRAAAAAAAAAGSGGTESGSLSTMASAAMVSVSGERSVVSLQSDGSNLQSMASTQPPPPDAAAAAAVPGDGDAAAAAAAGASSASPSAEPSAAVLSDALRSGAVSAEASLLSGGGGGYAAAAALAVAEQSVASLSPQPSAATSVGPQPEVAVGGGKDDGGGLNGDDDDDNGGGIDEALSVAAGRLAQMLGIGSGADGVERSSQLVVLDRTYDRLVDSVERLIEWSESLLKRKEQTASFSQVRQKLETVTRQLDAASLELNTLRPTAEALRHSVRGYEVKFKDMSLAMASCKQRAETAESRLESVEAQLTVVTQQLREAQDAQKLLEGEYWKAKDIALEAEVTTGELKAGRIRALEAAAKALASVSGLEKEARENRDQRVALEADLVGYKAWVRHMEAIERKYRDALKELSEATGGNEERDRKLVELKDRITTLEQQLRFKSIETASLESRVKALSGELVEERRAARVSVAAARGSAAAQLDTAIRQAGAAEAEAAARGQRLTVLEGRLAELSHALDEAQTTAAAAEARLVPLTAERDRLRAHIAATKPLLQAMDRAADAIGHRLALLEDVSTTRGGGGGGGAAVAPSASSGTADGSSNNHVRWLGLPEGSLECALAALLYKVDDALDACTAVAAEAAGDATPALLGALEGLVTQLLSTLSKGGKEPIQSLAVLKAQLARDDKELAAVRAAMGDMRAMAEAEAKEAAEQRAAAAAAAKAATAAVAAAARDGRRALVAESALMVSRRDLDSAVEKLEECRLVAETAKRQAERSQKRAAELEADLASAHSQRRHYEALAAAAQQKAAELKRRGDELEEEGLRDQDAAREALARAEAAEAAAAATSRRCEELEAAVEVEKREAERSQGDAAAAVAVAGMARDKALAVEQQMLEMQAKYADMIRHDESMEERLRQALFEAENMRKKAAEAMADAAEVNGQYEALQQRAWQLQVALQAKHGEKEEVLRDLVELTHGATARRSAAAAVGSASVKQRAEGTYETASSFKAKRGNDK